MPNHTVTLKQLESQTIISVRERVAELPEMRRLAGLLEEVRREHRETINGHPFVIYHDEDWRERDVDVEVCLPLKEEIPARAPLITRVLPAENAAASTIHHGPNDTMYGAYQAILAWCEENGYERAGPDRELYLTPGVSGDSPDQVKELVIPVKKAG